MTKQWQTTRTRSALICPSTDRPFSRTIMLGAWLSTPAFATRDIHASGTRIACLMQALCALRSSIEGEFFSFFYLFISFVFFLYFLSLASLPSLPTVIQRITVDSVIRLPRAGWRRCVHHQPLYNVQWRVLATCLPLAGWRCFFPSLSTSSFSTFASGRCTTYNGGFL